MAKERMTRRTAFAAGLRLLMGAATAYFVPAAIKVQAQSLTYEQERQTYSQMLAAGEESHSNPLVLEILNNYENRRMAMKYLS